MPICLHPYVSVDVHEFSSSFAGIADLESKIVHKQNPGVSLVSKSFKTRKTN